LENRQCIKFYKVENFSDNLKIILDTVRLFRKEATKKGTILEDPIISKNLFSSIIEISEPHIRQVLFNLIHNAVKYSYQSTSQSNRYVRIYCKEYVQKKPYKEFYRVEISNYGVGITPEELLKELIFKDGYRGILSRDRSRIGSGFGLGRVKEIVEAHNGKMKIKSRLVGHDSKIDPYITTVIICIPFFQ